MEKIIIGIDVGAQGCMGVCVFRNGRIVEINSYKPEKWIEACQDMKTQSIALDIPIFAYVEKLWSRPERSAHSSGQMMKNYGWTLGILETIPIEYVEVSPQIWTKKIDAKAPKGTPYDQRKNLLWQKAKEIFPNESIFKYQADGLLIMYYGTLIEKEKKDGN